MAATFDVGRGIFTLTTRNTTYQMMADSFGYLLHLYYGAKTAGFTDWGLTFADRGFSGSPYELGRDRTYSLDALPQEFPTQGTGDYRSPMLVVRDSEGTCGADLHYVSHEITEGKYSLPGLPAVYANPGEEAQTLAITLRNERLGLNVRLLYGVIPDKDIITRSVIVSNNGEKAFTVQKLYSSCLDFTHGDFDLITFYGRHAFERQYQRHNLKHGIFSVGSRRGMSSHQYSPFIILAGHDATESHGRCWGMHFVYSGGFCAEAEHDQYRQTRLIMGLAQDKFSYELEPGEEITGPEVIMTFSSEGLGKLSHSFHACIRENICRGKFRDSPRPVILNTWEALYFDFDGRKILDVAESAKALGVDMLVLDDGWFMNRNDDFRALGDWKADEAKLGCTLSELVNKVKSIGLDFGIWVEPEMISEDSELYRGHRDWAMVIPGEKPVLARNQLVLDLSRRDVREYIIQSMRGILNEGVTYLKWDYNRSIAELYSHEGSNGKLAYKYILGLYEILERITSEYPGVLIEGCAGGGGRFDAGMLYYTPQIWCSDNTDAVDRLSIHYGTSFGFPMSAVAAHVSTCPNHQTGRITPLSTRYTVSMTGAFGYELDPLKLTDDERREISRQIQQYKVDREIITSGLYYRLSRPEDINRYCAWEYVSQDGSKALINAVIPQNHGNMPVIYITPRGLTHGAFYRDIQTGETYPADALMDSGFPLDMPKSDCESFTLRLERV
ncbi:MAG: alpha-galactosidase [Synergistaceae bacterium]|nr:alpha-galactosidase [Synergistaceae bacterium]